MTMQGKRGYEGEPGACAGEVEETTARGWVHDLLPRSAAIIDAFTAMRNDRDFGPVLEVAVQLAANHQRQWQAEDACRVPDVSQAGIAENKRLIDDLNARRVALVERIDAWVAREIWNAHDASLHTETLGSVVDRLAIAWVRARYLSTSAGASDRPRAALRQMIELGAAYDDLIRDVSVGRRRLLAWLPMRTYGGMIRSPYPSTVWTT